MNHSNVVPTLVAVCLLMVAACGDKHEPVKPTVLIGATAIHVAR